jgi:uncharacterized protein YbjT (DUF2867 family)
MIAVMGASGHTGRVVAEALLARGAKVRAIARNAGALAPLARKGAEVAAGDAADPTFLARAFTGAEAAYTLVPGDLAAPDVRAHQDRIGEATARALGDARVPRVVLLSSVGADLASGNGPIAGLHAQEARLRALGADVLALRPGYFFENLHASLPIVKHQGVNAGALAPDVPMAMIATRDIGAAAAEALAARDFSGFTVRELLGPRDLTQAEVTRILGAAIGRPDLAYVQLPYEAFEAALAQAGLSRDLARLYAEMARGLNERRIRPVAPRSAASTTPTTFESFAPELAAAYRAL